MDNIWKSIKTEHYIFNYKSESLAEEEIQQVIDLQESCFKEITDTLKITPRSKINYWLCDSRKEVMDESKFEFETNGVTFCNPENPTIYAVYNETTKCVGYHEDVHAIACQYAFPSSIAIVEGLAMHFDKVWWKVPNELCTYVYLTDGKYESVEQLILDNDFFYAKPDSISYPIMGAFTAFLIERYGSEKYMVLYQEHEDWEQAFEDIYELNLTEIEMKFVEWCKKKEYSEHNICDAREKLYNG